VIEPLGASWLVDPDSDAQAAVSHRVGSGPLQSFREFVVVLQDELALHSGNPLFAGADPFSPTAVRNILDTDDAEDSGQKGLNYRTEPLFARLGLPPQADANQVNMQQQGDLLSSTAHGDPETPIFRARVGESYRVRVLAPSTHARQHAVSVHGAEWPLNAHAQGSGSRVIGPNDRTAIINVQGGISSMSTWNLVPRFGAGGAFQLPGDYLVRDVPSSQLYGGTWGILRVIPPEVSP
jgi:hypothetical protein